MGYNPTAPAAGGGRVHLRIISEIVGRPPCLSRN